MQSSVARPYGLCRLLICTRMSLVRIAPAVAAIVRGRVVHFDGLGWSTTAAFILKALSRPAPISEIHPRRFCVVSLAYHANPVESASLLNLVTRVLLSKWVSAMLRQSRSSRRLEAITSSNCHAQARFLPKQQGCK